MKKIFQLKRIFNINNIVQILQFSTRVNYAPIICQSVLNWSQNI